MPVSTPHPEYATMFPEWQKCRDTFDGSRAVKAAGILYLPKLGGQDTNEYDAYKLRSLFYAIIAKTISAMVGLASSKEPAIDRPDEMDYLFKDHNGKQYMEVFCDTLVENLLTGRIGVLVDRVDGGKAQPYTYPAETIVNWKVNDNGDPIMVVLRESTYQQVGDDKYRLEEVTQYRELYLDEEGLYAQQLFNVKGEAIGTPILISNAGQRMDFIPFFVATSKGLGFRVEKSPAIDLVEINLSHYRTSADLEHGRHFTALPTPIIKGVDSGTKLRIGSATAWVIPDVKGDAKYLEFTGQGLKSLETALQEKESQLASLSARLLDNSGKGSENSEVVRLRYASEGANLASVLRSNEALLNKVYKVAALMEGYEPDEVVIVLPKEFLDSRMSFVELEKLIASFLQGGISDETLIYNLRRGDVLSPKTKDKKELKALKKEQKKLKKEQEKKLKSPTESGTKSEETK